MQEKLDFIGDIHGHYEELVELLHKLGYEGDDFHHKEGRKVVFLGDYIDRGAHNLDTLDLVKRMVDNGNGYAIMGNHEYNAICFHTFDTVRECYLRSHNDAHITQHTAFIKEINNDYIRLQKYLNWMKKLPIFLETSSARAIHACWDSEMMCSVEEMKGVGLINSNNTLTDDFILKSAIKGSDEYELIERLLKGPEADMVNGSYFYDKNGKKRTRVRLKWWPTIDNTFKETVISVPQDEFKRLINEDAKLENQIERIQYSEDKPVFFGHYWMSDTEKTVFGNCACVDFSIAKNGHLAAYRYNSGEILDTKNYVTVLSK